MLEPILEPLEEHGAPAIPMLGRQGTTARPSASSASALGSCEGQGAPPSPKVSGSHPFFRVEPASPSTRPSRAVSAETSTLSTLQQLLPDASQRVLRNQASTVSELPGTAAAAAAAAGVGAAGFEGQVSRPGSSGGRQQQQQQQQQAGQEGAQKLPQWGTRASLQHKSQVAAPNAKAIFSRIHSLPRGPQVRGVHATPVTFTHA